MGGGLNKTSGIECLFRSIKMLEARKPYGVCQATGYDGSVTLDGRLEAAAGFPSFFFDESIKRIASSYMQ